jgi:cobalt-zinc-cadmium efflux system membrane fusion protein
MKRNPLWLAAAAAVVSFLAWQFFGESRAPGGDPHGHEETGHDGHAEHEGHADHGAHEDPGGGRIRLDAAAMAQSDIALDTAGPRRMDVTLSLQGRIVPNGERLAHVHPRFPGLIREVRKQLGQRVRKGDVLAVVESNESLQPYAVTAQINGTVIRKHAAVGETASGDEELFTVADLSTVWVDFQVYRQDFPRLKQGQRVRVNADGGHSAETVLAYLAPVSEEHTQAMLVRATLDNRKGDWPPGLYVKGEAAVESFDAPVAVRLEGVQTLEGDPVVFVGEGEAFEARPVRLGRRDGDWVEVTEGMRAGEAYVSRNSFVLKADLGKGEVAHEH